MKIRKGYTILELVISISLIAMLFLISVPKFNKERIEYESFIFELKSDLRQLGLESINRPNIYKMIFNRDGYRIYRSSDEIKSKKCKKGIIILSEEKIILYSRKARSGAPEKGRSIYIIDRNLKKVERITIMLGSGRVKSYSEDYYSLYGKE